MLEGRFQAGDTVVIDTATLESGETYLRLRPAREAQNETEEEERGRDRLTPPKLAKGLRAMLAAAFLHRVAQHIGIILVGSQFRRSRKLRLRKTTSGKPSPVRHQRHVDLLLLLSLGRRLAAQKCRAAGRRR